MKFDEKYYKYLDALRESGKTNMFGAGVYVAKQFKLNIDEANKIVGDWMKTFNKRHTIKVKKE